LTDDHIFIQYYIGTSADICYCHGSLSAPTHAPFHASMLRPVSHADPMHESAGVGKLANAALL